MAMGQYRRFINLLHRFSVQFFFFNSLSQKIIYRVNLETNKSIITLQYTYRIVSKAFTLCSMQSV